MNRPTRFLLAISTLLIGCDDDEERITRLPLQFYSIEHPDSLPVGHADTLEVGAIVGYGRCTLENGGIEQHGDSLIVRGNALCRYRVCRRDCPNGPTIATAPEFPNAQWLRFPLRDLAPGRYFIVAGDLVDTLIVAGVAGTLPQRRFSGIGWIGQLTCPPVVFELQAPLRRYELDLPPPVEPMNIELHGTIVGPSKCDPLVVPTIHVRSMVPGSSIP